MIEQKTIPALLFDDYGIFPGQTLSAHLDITKLEENETLYVAVTQYNNSICLGKTLLENSTCFYCQIASYTTDPKSNKIILELQIKQRAKFISAVNDICVSIEVYNDTLETEEQKNLFSEIKSTVLNDGNFYFYFVDKNVISYMFKPETNPSETCDIIIGNLLPNLVDEKKIQKFITSLDFTERLKMTKEIVTEISKQSKIDQEVETKTQEAINKEQKEYYLRKKIRIIQEELGDVDKISDDAEKIREKIDKAGMTKEAKEQALKELKRYQSTISTSPEASMIRQYLDTLVSIP
jgi:ATP-dependent Lon protease